MIGTGDKSLVYVLPSEKDGNYENCQVKLGWNIMTWTNERWDSWLDRRFTHANGAWNGDWMTAQRDWCTLVRDMHFLFCQQAVRQSKSNSCCHCLKKGHGSGLPCLVWAFSTPYSINYLYIPYLTIEIISNLHWILRDFFKSLYNIYITLYSRLYQIFIYIFITLPSRFNQIFIEF